MLLNRLLFDFNDCSSREDKRGGSGSSEADELISSIIELMWLKIDN